MRIVTIRDEKKMETIEIDEFWEQKRLIRVREYAKPSFEAER